MSETAVTSGGPESVTQTQVTAPPVVVEKREESIYKGLSGDIKSQEALIEYTKNVEAELIRERVSKAAPAPMAVPVVDQLDKQIEEVWYSDPKKAMNLIEQKVENKLTARDAHKDQQKKFWEGFYKDAEDLNNDAGKRLVDTIVSAKMKELQPLSFEDAKKTIMKEARDLVGSLRKDANATKIEVPSKTAHVIGASGEPMKTAGTTPQQPKSTIDQLLEFRRKRRKSA